MSYFNVICAIISVLSFFVNPGNTVPTDLILIGTKLTNFIYKLFQGKFDVIFKEVNITCDVKHLECTASLRKERGQRPVIDLVINVVRVPENVYVSLMLFKYILRVLHYSPQIQSQIHSMLAIGPTSVVSGQRIEFCKFCKNPKIDLFLNAFFRLYKDAGSSLTSCPIEQVRFNAFFLLSLKSAFSF